MNDMTRDALAAYFAPVKDREDGWIDAKEAAEFWGVIPNTAKLRLDGLVKSGEFETEIVRNYNGRIVSVYRAKATE